MRLLLATIAVLKVITASADDDNTIFKQHGSLQYVDNFLSPEESKHFYDTMESLSQVHPFDPTAKSRGNIMVSSLIQRRLKDVAGSDCSIDDDMIDTNGGIILQTRIINKSTKPHIDYEAEGKVVEDDVMFITLNSNPEAHFNHGGNSLPAVAGRLVRFAGNAVHGTTLNSGNVRLLGPFSIKNFASVGENGPACPFGGFCIPSPPTNDNFPEEGARVMNANGDVFCPSEGDECYVINNVINFETGCPPGGICITEGGDDIGPDINGVDTQNGIQGSPTTCPTSGTILANGCYECISCPTPTTTMATTTQVTTTTSTEPVSTTTSSTEPVSTTSASTTTATSTTTPTSKSDKSGKSKTDKSMKKSGSMSKVSKAESNDAANISAFQVQVPSFRGSSNDEATVEVENESVQVNPSSQVKKDDELIAALEDEEASPKAKVSWGISFEDDETVNAIDEGGAEEDQSSGFYDVYIEAGDENV